MDQPFLTSLIPASVNLVAMVLIYSLLANALVRLHWRGRGATTVIALIFIAGLIWVGPFSLTLSGLSVSPRALWLGNWLVSGSSIVILCQRVRWIPRELEDSARLDGCSWLGIYWHILLPLVRRELGLIALLTIMATALPFGAALVAPGHGPLWPLFERLPVTRLLPQYGLGAAIGMILTSLLMTAPVIVIFFLARPYLEGPSIRLGEAKPQDPGAV